MALPTISASGLSSTGTPVITKQDLLAAFLQFPTTADFTAQQSLTTAVSTKADAASAAALAAQGAAAGLQDAVSTATATANAAQATAGSAQSSASTAGSAATSAQSAAVDAQSKATSAVTTANAAQSLALAAVRIQETATDQYQGRRRLSDGLILFWGSAPGQLGQGQNNRITLPFGCSRILSVWGNALGDGSSSPPNCTPESSGNSFNLYSPTYSFYTYAGYALA